MKKLALALIACSLVTFGCQTKETRVEGPTATTVTTETTGIVVDTAAAKDAVQDAGAAAEDAARDAGTAAGTALEEAGKEIQEHSKPTP